MRIESKVLDTLGIARYDTVKKFLSKRNNVYLIRGKRTGGADFLFIYKEYVEGDIEREYAYLQRLRGLPVPLIMARGDRSLALSYIAGGTMLERLEEAENREERFEGCIDGFLDFLQRFYSALPGQIYGDVNLRNFIVTNKGICGVDLEEAGPGRIYADIGRAAAFLLTYDPSFTVYKKRLVQYLVENACERFGLDKSAAEDAMAPELEDIRARRGRKSGRQFKSD